MKRILRVDEAAQVLSVSIRTIYRLIDEGRIEALRVSTGNSPFRITSESIDDYIRRQKNEFTADIS